MNDFFTDASKDHCHGPEKLRRCRLPTSPGPGLKKICPAKGADPGDEAARPSGPITAGSMKYTVSPVFQIPLVSEFGTGPCTEAVLFTSDRCSVVFPLRFSVPKPDRIEYGAPEV